MALQTREQHIKRERATSNICTAQALLATMAGMYAVYHGPSGIRRIASYIHSVAMLVAKQLQLLGYTQNIKNIFDTLEVTLPAGVSLEDIRRNALENELNLNYKPNGSIGISFDEVTTINDINALLNVFAKAIGKEHNPISSVEEANGIPANLQRRSPYLTEKVFNSYQSEPR